MCETISCSINLQSHIKITFSHKTTGIKYDLTDAYHIVCKCKKINTAKGNNENTSNLCKRKKKCSKLHSGGICGAGGGNIESNMKNKTDQKKP